MRKIHRLKTTQRLQSVTPHRNLTLHCVTITDDIAINHFDHIIGWHSTSKLLVRTIRNTTVHCESFLATKKLSWLVGWCLEFTSVCRYRRNLAIVKWNSFRVRLVKPSRWVAQAQWETRALAHLWWQFLFFLLMFCMATNFSAQVDGWWPFKAEVNERIGPVLLHRRKMTLRVPNLHSVVAA